MHFWSAITCLLVLEDESREKWVLRVREHPVNHWAHLVDGETLADCLLGPDPSIKALRAERSESGTLFVAILLSVY